MATKPSKIGWGTSNIAEPSGAKKTAGWVALEKPPYQFFNWFWNIVTKIQNFAFGQVENWIIISDDVDERDYASLAAYIAGTPVAGDRVLIKSNQTLTAQAVIPANITLKCLDGVTIGCATNIGTSVLKFGSGSIIEGVLPLSLSQAGTTVTAVEVDGDNNNLNIDVILTSAGTITNAFLVNASKEGNLIDGNTGATGGGTITNHLADNSANNSNAIIIRDTVGDTLHRSYMMKDADTVDTYHALQLAKLAEANNFTQNQTIEKSIPAINLKDTGNTAGVIKGLDSGGNLRGQVAIRNLGAGNARVTLDDQNGDVVFGFDTDTDKMDAGIVPLARMQRTEVSGENASTVTLVASPTVNTIVDIDLGTVNSGDRILVNACADLVKASTAGIVLLEILQASGTATIQANHNKPSIADTYWLENGATYDRKLLSGIIKVTGTGTLVLRLRGYSEGSNADVNSGGGELHAIVLNNG